MSKYDFPTQFECHNRILNVKIRFSDSVRMSKYDFEYQNSISRLSSRILNAKYDFPTQFECQNRILNIKIGFSDSVRMSKTDFECQNGIFLLSSNVEIGF